MKERLVWAEINLAKFRQNLQAIKKRVGNTKIMAVLKANAYGHGIARIAREAEKENVDYLGVACLYEGRLIREAGVKLPILLLGYTDIESVPSALQHDLTITIVDELVLEAVIKEAEKQGKKGTVHINIDTGFRLHGCAPNDAIPLMKKASLSPNIILEGVFSHFAMAGDDPSFATKQLETFKNILATLKSMGITPPLIHMANSAATITMPQSYFDMVRVGTFLYGPRTGEQLPGFVPETLLALKTIVTQTRDVLKGESIGYGKRSIASHSVKLASIPVGFGDGFPRIPNWGFVLIRGKRAPIVTVAMDSTAVDITNIPNVSTGDEVILLGTQGKEQIKITMVAKTLQKTNYETLSNLSERVSRIYTS